MVAGMAGLGEEADAAPVRSAPQTAWVSGKGFLHPGLHSEPRTPGGMQLSAGRGALEVTTEEGLGKRSREGSAPGTGLPAAAPPSEYPAPSP